MKWISVLIIHLIWVLPLHATHKLLINDMPVDPQKIYTLKEIRSISWEISGLKPIPQERKMLKTWMNVSGTTASDDFSPL